MKRTGNKQGAAPPPAGAGDYFIVTARMQIWYESTEMARHIEACLDAQPRAAWIRFVDLSGGRARIRSRDVESIAQSTAEQRAAERAFFKRMRQERKGDRDWDSPFD